jgi:itaconate CoA-transferase
MSDDLQGVLVVALEQAVAAPYCTRLMAESGARVIKLERPDGDFARAYDGILDGDSAYFVWLNSGKESLVADLANPEDKKLLQSILLKADVFIQNLRPGAADKLGFSYEDVKTINPRIIMCSISGYGTEGSYSKMKAYDALIQAESGLCSVTGPPGQPSKVGASIVDISTGLSAYGEILKALFGRTTSGHGRHIELSLFEVLSEWLAVPLSYFEYGKKLLTGTGMDHGQICPYGSYEASDGPIFIVIQNHNEWVRLCEQVLERKDLASHPLYKTNVLRMENKKTLRTEIENVFGTKTRQTLQENLLEAGVACGSINDLSDLSTHPALQRKTVHSSGNQFTLVRRVGETRDNAIVPNLGEHTQKIVKEFS